MFVVLRTGLCVLTVFALSAVSAAAEETRIDVRVLARGAKFLPGSRSVPVTLRDADSGEVLARGWTAGGTGDTGRIMSATTGGRRRVPEDGAALYAAVIDIARPRLVALEVGPVEGPSRSGVQVSTQWVLPGRHLINGDGWLVEAPGLLVDLSTPVAYGVHAVGEEMRLLAGVTMMCGCGLEPGGTWDSDGVEVTATVYLDGERIAVLPLSYAGRPSRFEGRYRPDRPGVHEIEVQAWAPQGNNAGVGRTAVFVR